MVKVMYKHQPGDPETTEWRGTYFKSGEAIDFDGRTKEGKELIEAARSNPWFEVDGEKSAPQKSGDNGGDEETAEQYRAYALNWIKTAKSSRELDTRWKAEEPRREKAGWGTDDQALIDPILQPKLQMLKSAEAEQ